MPTPTALAVVFALYALALGLSLAYFARVRMPPPPIGVMNLSDVAVAMGCIVLVGYLHVLMPAAVATAFLAVVMGTLFLLLLEPLVGRAIWRWALASGLVALGLASPHLAPGDPNVYTAVNDALIVLAVVAVANAWMQSGLRVRHLVVMALAIAAYDVVVTCRMTVTEAVFIRLDQRPFAPLIGWRDGPVWPGVGLGDTLMAAGFVLGLEKGWGRRAAMAGLGAMVAALAIAFFRPFVGALCVSHTYPVMAIIAPVQVAVYLLVRRLHGPEATLADYRARSASRISVSSRTSSLGSAGASDTGSGARSIRLA